MEPASEPPFTVNELIELQALELARRGETQDDVARSLRARLEELREAPAGMQPPTAPRGQSIEARVRELETEVGRLRVLIENGSKNG
jgi:hypothetical protein